MHDIGHSVRHIIDFADPEGTLHRTLVRTGFSPRVGFMRSQSTAEG